MAQIGSRKLGEWKRIVDGFASKMENTLENCLVLHPFSSTHMQDLIDNNMIEDAEDTGDCFGTFQSEEKKPSGRFLASTERPHQIVPVYHLEGWGHQAPNRDR
jgi:hypothetical protein